MLSTRIMQLMHEIEQLSLEQQEEIAEALAIEIADVQSDKMTLEELVAELDADIAKGDVYDLDELERLP